ncbi:MAG TPA: pyridoxal 5'-phosphate synthase glutaminase subunit PdxT [Proteiniclasticum sp.]|nr:pyridoxal 5'-phosphate synthase glutaminase subunit PdxT [Proteiniclasticum sp.]
MKKQIGVLAVQGDFEDHMEALRRLGIDCIEIRKKSDLMESKISGIILPGGESTVMGKLLHELEIFDELRRMIMEGLPVFGTCAGLILLAKTCTNDDRIYLGTMDIEVRRNGYGRQLGSFSENGLVKGIGEVPMTFIRAPYIERTSQDVEVLATVHGNVVAARQGNMLVTSFHPELTMDLKLHAYFVDALCNE